MTTVDLPSPEGALKVPAQPTQPKLHKNTVELSLVIPTYNERDNIEPLVTQLTAVLNQAMAGSYEIIFVDDGSPDKTYERIREIGQEHTQVKLIYRKGERGLATAVIRGWQAASGDILGVIDGDLQHPPETLIPLIEQIRSGADIAIASRHLLRKQTPGLTWLRRRLSLGAQMLCQAFVPSVAARTTDPMSGFFLVRRNVIAERPLCPVGYKILVEVLARGVAGKIAEVPFVFQCRQAGRTKVSWLHYPMYLWHLIKLRWSPGQDKSDS